jgi:DNA-binding NtrC family response regulator
VFSSRSTLAAATHPVEVLGPAASLGGEHSLDDDRRGGFRIPSGLTLKEDEKSTSSGTLSKYGGNVQRSAEILDISRKNLWEKRKRHGPL